MSRREWVKFAHRTAVRGTSATFGALAVRRAMLTHATPRKLANFAAVKLQKRLRLETVRGRPYRYKLDPTNVCSMKCPLCPTGSGQLNRRQGFMDFGLYRGLIDRIAPDALILDLFGWGEPLLHPGLPAMIRYASERNLFTRLSTALNDDEPGTDDAIIASGLDAVVIAADGASEATYGAYRRGGRLSRMIAGTTRLLEARNRAGVATPHITLRMLINRYNEHEVGAVRDLAVRLGADAFTVGALALDDADEDARREWLPRRSPINDYADGDLNRGCCDDLWEAMIVNWDGGVAPCCWIYDSQHDLGTLADVDMDELWNGPAFRTARRAAAGRGRRVDDPPVICGSCRGHPAYLAGDRARVSRSG